MQPMPLQLLAVARGKARSRAKRHKPEEVPARIALAADRELCLIEGLWYEVRLAPMPEPEFRASIADADFSKLAAHCAPSVPEWVLRGVARTESDFRLWMLHDNTAHISVDPSSLAVAGAEATAWIGKGHSVDLGLMQINSRNLSALGMSVSNALDPCASLAAGAALLRAAYDGRPVGTGQQAALLLALSVYNTGTPLKGIMNGYARAVMHNADEAFAPASMAPAGPLAAPGAPPSWDVSATGTYTQTHGAPWLVPLSRKPSEQILVAANYAAPSSQLKRSP